MTPLQATVEELDKLSIKYEISKRKKHYSIKFEYNGKKFNVTCSSTPSDYRAPIKARSLVKRLIRKE